MRRANAPPRTRSWTTRIDASDAVSRSTMSAAVSRSTSSVKSVREDAMGRVRGVVGRIHVRERARGDHVRDRLGRSAEQRDRALAGFRIAGIASCR